MSQPEIEQWSTTCLSVRGRHLYGSFVARTVRPCYLPFSHCLAPALSICHGVRVEHSCKRSSSRSRSIVELETSMLSSKQSVAASVLDRGMDHSLTGSVETLVTLPLLYLSFTVRNTNEDPYYVVARNCKQHRSTGQSPTAAVKQ